MIIFKIIAKLLLNIFTVFMAFLAIIIIPFYLLIASAKARLESEIKDLKNV